MLDRIIISQLNNKHAQLWWVIISKCSFWNTKLSWGSSRSRRDCFYLSDFRKKWNAKENGIQRRQQQTYFPICSKRLQSQNYFINSAIKKIIPVVVAISFFFSFSLWIIEIFICWQKYCSQNGDFFLRAIWKMSWTFFSDETFSYSYYLKKVILGLPPWSLILDGEDCCAYKVGSWPNIICWGGVGQTKKNIYHLFFLYKSKNWVALASAKITRKKRKQLSIYERSSHESAIPPIYVPIRQFR